MRFLTPEEFEKEMRELEGYDEETRHYKADQLMCDLLKYLGYKKGIKIFESWEKWYA